MSKKMLTKLQSFKWSKSKVHLTLLDYQYHYNKFCKSNYINKFSVCYKIMQVIYPDYKLSDIASQYIGWQRYINNENIIYIKYTNDKKEPNWSFDTSEKFSKIVLAFGNEKKLSYLEVQLPEIIYKIDKQKITMYLDEKDNIISFHPKKNKIANIECIIKDILDLSTKGVSFTLNRYKSLMERNTLHIFNYLLFALFIKNNESKDLEEHNINELVKYWDEIKNTNKIYESKYISQNTKVIPDKIKVMYKKSYKKDLNKSLNNGMDKVRDRNQFFKYFLDNKKNSTETEKKEPIIEFIKKVKEYVNWYYEYYQENIMSFNEFEKIWNVENRACGYCGVTEKDIKKLDKNNQIETKRFYSRGKTMEIDKIDPNGEYESTNIILSCYWCNNAKTDEYDLCEFKEIARGINGVWSKRLGIQVLFPENTYVRAVCPYTPKTPHLTTDGIVEIYDDAKKLQGIVLIQRKNIPLGLALPGGFVDVGESVEDAVIREMKEEISLDVEIQTLLDVYSDPSRDKRFHTASVVYVCKANGIPVGADDAKEAKIYKLDAIPLDRLVFDHKKILEDYIAKR